MDEWGEFAEFGASLGEDGGESFVAFAIGEKDGELEIEGDFELEGELFLLLREGVGGEGFV